MKTDVFPRQADSEGSERVQKKRSRISTFVRRYPALSLFILALVLGNLPTLAVATGLLPLEARQIGAFSASLAGIILAAVEGRKGGVRELLRRSLVWRVGLRWWAFALFFIVVLAVTSVYLARLFGGPPVDWSGLDPLYSVIPSMIILIILAGMGEEFGWRGYAMPRLQSRHNALVSSLIIGVLWGLWHLPLYFIEGTGQYDWRMTGGFAAAFLGYTGFVTAWAVQYTWVFNNTKGSVLLAAVVHGVGNAWLGYIDIFGRSQFTGMVISTVLMVIVSTIIVLAAGPANLSRTNHRNVLAPEPGQPGIAQAPEGAAARPLPPR